jgi:hypothetical protein
VGDGNAIWTPRPQLGNIKTRLRHLPRHPQETHGAYLAEFEWHFNHRFDLARVILVLGRAAAQYKSVTYGRLRGLVRN